MLIKCPECELQVSDKALSCPHCGYPLKGEKKNKRNSKTNRRKRLPNGFGQITKIKDDRLRKPYRAMITVGKDSKGKPMCRLLKPEAYFETYNDAYMALVEYNKNPYDLDSTLTIAQLYDKWTKEYFKSLQSESSKRTITSAWAYCSSIYDMRAKDIRGRHIKGCMDNGVIIDKSGKEHYPTAGVKARIKSLFNLMFDYALEYEIVDRNYARTFNVSKDIRDETQKAKRGHISFSNKEISILWDNINNIKYVDVILIQCYSGWRPQELGLIKLEDVDLENGYFKGGMKTDAGTNRIVPIHSKIMPLVKNKYEEAKRLNSEYLLNCIDAQSHKGNIKLTYDKYQQRFCRVRDLLKLHPDHRAHDGRVTFVTMAKKHNVDEYAIKYIVGHSINDITEKVYTKRKKEWLKTEIEKII